MFKKADKNNAKYRVVLVEGTTVLARIYYRSLYLAHHKASELRRVFGVDNVQIIDNKNEMVIEGL
jgi:hypothetical protein